MQTIGEVAYRLKLPPGSKIHDVFHVSMLKRAIGPHVQVQDELPSYLDNEDTLSPPPQAIVKQRIRNKRLEYLIQWQGLPLPEATWLDAAIFEERYPEFNLGDKVAAQRGGMQQSSAPATSASSSYNSG